MKLRSLIKNKKKINLNSNEKSHNSEMVAKGIKKDRE